ncbi:MAG: zinc-finger domain-containing protein [Alphaproteobacteria bacterium]|nr:zinc-finger domain-containing protein [Alphaproteobacteria bacterium]
MEPIETKDSVIKCDGGGGVLGHPVIYLNLGKEEKIVCPYCSRCFIMATEKKHPSQLGLIR